jgi:hypothetical protein
VAKRIGILGIYVISVGMLSRVTKSLLISLFLWVTYKYVIGVVGVGKFLFPIVMGSVSSVRGLEKSLIQKKGVITMGKIKDYIGRNDGVVQVACTYTNSGLCGVYLTNSGMVCRKEFGYVEDCDLDEGDEMEDGRPYETLFLPIRTITRVERLQEILGRLV